MLLVVGYFLSLSRCVCCLCTSVIKESLIVCVGTTSFTTKVLVCNFLATDGRGFVVAFRL